MGKKHLIIGCGSAALNALEALRAINQEDEVKLVTREELMPYSPSALPFLLTERIQEADLWLRDGSFFERMKSTPVLGKELEKIRTGEKKVFYRDGSSEGYDSLLIATGSTPVVRKIKGLEATGCLTFRTFYDYRAIKDVLKAKGLEKGGGVVIYGGGLVALELAIPLLKAGYEVDLVVRSRLLRSYVDKDLGQRIREILWANRARVHEGCTIEEVKRDSKGWLGGLSNGEFIRSHTPLLLALGVQPAKEFLQDSGIKTGQGIIVDKRMRTNVKDVYAAGDVAEAQEFFHGKRGLSGILPSAVRQGKVAGTNMGGGDMEYEGWIPMNLFNVFGHLVFSVGLSQGDRVEVMEDREQDKGPYKQMFFRNDRLVGARFMDVAVDPGVFLYLIEKRIDVGPYKELMFSRPRETSRWLMLREEEGLMGRGEGRKG